MINIKDIIPFMRKGWVAMDKNGVWFWFESKPKLKKRDGIWSNDNYSLWQEVYCSVFQDIAPAEDWTKSLISVGNKPNNKVLDVDEYYKEMFEND